MELLVAILNSFQLIIFGNYFHKKSWSCQGFWISLCQDFCCYETPLTHKIFYRKSQKHFNRFKHPFSNPLFNKCFVGSSEEKLADWILAVCMKNCYPVHNLFFILFWILNYPQHLGRATPVVNKFVLLTNITKSYIFDAERVGQFQLLINHFLVLSKKIYQLLFASHNEFLLHYMNRIQSVLLLFMGGTEYLSYRTQIDLFRSWLILCLIKTFALFANATRTAKSSSKCV